MVMRLTTNGVLLAAEQITKTFPLPEGHGDFTALRDVSVTVREGEVVALLGRSGSGKSTLLRIIAGLIPPSQGQVLSSGLPLRGPNPDVAMVFQSFALLPWLTVQENVELGLQARGVGREERRARALQVNDQRDGGYRSITVRLKRDDLVVRARKGYRAPRAENRSIEDQETKPPGQSKP